MFFRQKARVMTLTCHAYDQSFVEAIRAGGPDANGQRAEHAVSPGTATPCRSCLQNVPKGDAMLILAARPFPAPQPYAETGPIFLCAAACPPWQEGSLPEILTTSITYLLKGYGADHRIIYGTGRIVAREGLKSYAADLLSEARVAYVDVRSASNNCFLTRITRSDDQCPPPRL